MFRRLDSVSIFIFNLLIWAQTIELVPVSGRSPIVANWVGYIWKQRQNPVSETFCIILNKKRTMDDV
jgi:hypothetical protein